MKTAGVYSGEKDGIVSIVTKTEADVTDSVSDGVMVSKHDQLFQVNTN